MRLQFKLEQKQPCPLHFACNQPKNSKRYIYKLQPPVLQFFLNFCFYLAFLNFSVLRNEEENLKNSSQNFGKIALCDVVGSEGKSECLGNFPTSKIQCILWKGYHVPMLALKIFFYQNYERTRKLRSHIARGTSRKH